MRPYKKRLFIFAIVYSISCVLAAGAQASVDQAKLYQKVFGGEKPKCIGCHVDKLPKKDDGKHELNEYGRKLKEAKAAEKPDEGTYNTVGKNPTIES